MSHPIEKAIGRRVRAARRILRRRRIKLGVATGAWISVAGVLGIALLSRFWWWGPVPAFVIAPVLAFIPPVIGGFLGALWSGLSDREMTYLLDRLHGTDELLITSAHVLDQPESGAREQILTAAVTSEASLQPERRVLFARWPRRSGWIPVAILAVLLAFLLPTRLIQTRLADVSDVQEEGERLDERLEELRDAGVELPADVAIDLEELIEDMLGDEIDELEARDRLEELQEQLAEAQDEMAESEDLLDEIEQAAQQLAESEALQPLADALVDLDMGAAAEAASELEQALENATPEERREAGEALEQAGETLSGSASDQLSQAGEAMERMGEQLQDEADSQEESGEAGPESGSEPGQEGTPSGDEGSQQGEQGSQSSDPSGEPGSESGEQGSESGQQGSQSSEQSGSPGSQ
ncbi:MAG: tetratricopeptide (TPR) repeat protein, partial [Myxococcota bacterium]